MRGRGGKYTIGSIINHTLLKIYIYLQGGGMRGRGGDDEIGLEQNIKRVHNDFVFLPLRKGQWSLEENFSRANIRSKSGARLRTR